MKTFCEICLERNAIITALKKKDEWGTYFCEVCGHVVDGVRRKEAAALIDDRITRYNGLKHYVLSVKK